MRLTVILIISSILLGCEAPRSIEYVEAKVPITNVEYYPLCDVRITVPIGNQTVILSNQELFESHDIGDTIRVSYFVLPGGVIMGVEWIR